MIVCLLGASLRPALAGPADHDAHYQQGRQAFGAGNYKEAAEAFEAAYRLKPSPYMLANLGTAYLRQGEYLRAQTCYELYLNAVPSAPDRGAVEVYLRQARAAIKAQREERERRAAASEQTAREAAEAQRQAAAERLRAEQRALLAEQRQVAAERSRREAEQRAAIHRRWWFWTALGVAAVGVGVGVGLGVYYADPLRGVNVQAVRFPALQVVSF